MGYTTPGHVVLCYVIGLGVSMTIAGITCGAFMAQMNTAKLQISASAYVPKGGVKYSRKIDRFTHTTRHTERINTDSGSAGGGTSTDSDGFSGSGGSF